MKQSVSRRETKCFKHLKLFETIYVNKIVKEDAMG